MMKTANYIYGIDDGHGNELASGLDEEGARRRAQELANARGESVYVYPLAGQFDFAGEDAEGSEEVVPNSGSRLVDYNTTAVIRVATADEQAASREAAKRDGGAGVIEVDGRRCYVED